MRTLLVATFTMLAVFMGPHKSSMGMFCAGAMHAQVVAAQQNPPSMPPPGNPGHQKPEKGAYCDRGNHEAHSCKCHKKCATNDKGEIIYEDNGEPKIVEASNCRAWCFKDHCHCSAICP